MDLAQHTWAQRDYRLDGGQQRALMEALAAQPGILHTSRQQRCLLFDTPDSAVLRGLCADSGFAELLLLKSGREDLCGSSRVCLCLYRRAGQRWTCRQADIRLRDVELFLRAGILPPDIACMATLRLAHVYRLRTGVRPALVASCTRHLLHTPRDESVRLFIDEDLRTRRMALSLEAGAFGERVLPPGQSLLRIQAQWAIPLWLSCLLRSLDIRHVWTPGMLHADIPSEKGVTL